MLQFHKLMEGFPQAPSGMKASTGPEWFGTARGWLRTTDAGKEAELKEGAREFSEERGQGARTGLEWKRPRPEAIASERGQGFCGLHHGGAPLC